MAEKVLVIGSNSFSGSSFAAWLLDQGHEVIGTSRSPEPNRVFLPYRWKGKDARFRFVIRLVQSLPSPESLNV